ncbi:MAG: hypothetical protein GF365_02170 [Candidatus Buchananbacteria bacterium]|nr:hypothetical protein [Candidatus Buchananbacteria bacterium]
MVGVDTITGYYKVREDVGLDGKVFCDTLVVPEYDSALIDGDMEAINSGNIVNVLNEQGQIMLNLDLSVLSEEDKHKIATSTEESMVDVTIFQKYTAPRGSWACESFFKIIDVK